MIGGGGPGGSAGAAGPFLLSDRWLQRMCQSDAVAPDEELRAWAATRADCQRMVDSRRHEYLLGRQCARDLLRTLRAPRMLIGARPDRAPDWPAGFTGSITHAGPLVAVVAGRGDGVAVGVGVDVEDVLGERDLAHVEQQCLTPTEQQWLHPLLAAERREFATVLFSAKEAFFKCLYPAVRCFFDFQDAEATGVEDLRAGSRQGRLRLQLLKHLAAGYGAGYGLQGTFRIADGRVFTAFER